ncbi:MAG TPA: hypothetical protein DCY91_23485 [Cyanobacteria bacterium UBA11370]|nr:hypothetical protein [Cyanobacteria bacterium UBA11370]HBY77346.1 hypothetical protein [Cyanobacteria bacterium UBA11148]
MLINKPNIVDSHEKTQATATPINLKPFVDFWLDTVGWYALGHHEPEQFIAAVVEKEPDCNYTPDQVQLAWAKFKGHDFEVTDVSILGSQAITLVEYWGEDDYEDD